jgi:hypothetical protein
MWAAVPRRELQSRAKGVADEEADKSALGAVKDGGSESGRLLRFDLRRHDQAPSKEWLGCGSRAMC